MLIVPSQYGRQKPPVGAQVNPDHPLAAGLLMAVLFNEGNPIPGAVTSGQLPHDLFGRTFSVVGGIGANPLWIPGRDGAGTQFVQNGGYFSNTSFPINALTNAVTIVTIAQPNNSGDTASLFGNHSGAAGGSTVRMQSHFPFSGTVYWDYGSGNVNNSTRVSFTPAASFFSKPHHMVYRGGGGVPLDIWADGILQVAGTSATTATFAAGDGIDLGHWSGATQRANMELFLVYNRVLTPQEIAWSNAKPYDFLKPITPIKRFVLMGLNSISVSKTAAVNLESSSAQVVQTASIKLESRIQVSQTRILLEESLIHASKTAAAPLEASNQPHPTAITKIEAKGRVANTGQTALESQLSALRVAITNLEDRTGINAVTIPIEFKRSAVQTGLIQTEFSQLNVHSPQVIDIEYVRQIAKAGVIGVEFKRRITQGTTGPLEALGNRVVKTAIARIESSVGVKKLTTVFVESRGPVTQTASEPLESTGNHVAQTAALSIETIAGHYPLQLKIEATGRIVRALSMPLEMRGLEFNVSQTARVGLENYYGIHSYSPTPRWYFESKGVVTQTSAMPAESQGVHVAQTASVSLEAAHDPATAAAIPLEIRPHDVSPAPTALVRLETTHWLGVHRPLLIETWRKVYGQAPVSAEARGKVALTRQTRVESGVRVVQSKAISVEIAAVKATVQGNLNLEARGKAPAALATISIEAREPTGLLPPTAVGTLIIEQEGVGTLIVHEALPLSES